MEVKNAPEATEIARDFLSKMGWTIFVSPEKAEKHDGKWLVELTVGYKSMKFEIDAATGDILSYGPK